MTTEDLLIRAVFHSILGLHDLALIYLGKISDEDQTTSSVVCQRITILNNMGAWGDAAEIARIYVERIDNFNDPREEGIVQHGAYSILKSEGAQASLLFLRRLKGLVEDRCYFWYHWACAHCELGQMEEAAAALVKSIKCDESTVDVTQGSDDLDPLCDWCRANPDQPDALMLCEKLELAEREPEG